MTCMVPVRAYPKDAPVAIVPRTSEERGRALPHLSHKLIIAGDYIDSYTRYELAELAGQLLTGGVQ